MGKHSDLIVYQKAYAVAMEIHTITREFPKEERFGLIDQIRRSSKAVCSNLAEAYRRRKYLNHFLSKLNDCQAENTETEVWLDFARDLGYLSEEKWLDIKNKNDEVGKLLHYMINNPQKFR